MKERKKVQFNCGSAQSKMPWGEGGEKDPGVVASDSSKRDAIFDFSPFRNSQARGMGDKEPGKENPLDCPLLPGALNQFGGVCSDWWFCY